MAPVPFSNLAVGDKFIYNVDQVWVKASQKKKSCCKVLSNAHLVGNPDVTAVIRPRQPVTRYVEE